MGVPLACYMLGSSGHNTENLTANHSGGMCWVICQVPRTLKNRFVVFYRSRNNWAPPREAILTFGIVIHVKWRETRVGGSC